MLDKRYLIIKIKKDILYAAGRNDEFNQYGCKNQQNQYPTQSAIAQPSNTNANSNSKKPQSKMLNAVKEIAVTTGMGIAGGAAVGGITSLIPASNTGRVSDVLCDAFIKTADSDDNFDIAKNLI